MFSFQNVQRAIFACAIMVGVVACNAPQATDQQARQFVEQWYGMIKNGNFDAAAGMFDEQFFQREPKEAWVAQMTKNAEKLGPLQEMKLKEAQTNTIYSGRQFLFVFLNRYEKGNATETVVLLQPVDKQEIKVVAYKIESLLL